MGKLWNSFGRGGDGSLSRFNIARPIVILITRSQKMILLSSLKEVRHYDLK
ncbi:MAG TPA: hypothetical protein VMS35_01580 [Nitrososphaeraceae archaeon]|nr:hypothetical protein [Nitrososphaeraceae archaeon]